MNNMKFDFNQLCTKNGVEMNGPILLRPKVHRDERGFFYESWNEKEWKEILKTYNQTYKSFVQDNHSKSIKGVLRGLHFQKDPFPQGKLIRCLSGEIFDVAIDIRKESKTFGEWSSVILSEKNNKQFWIPEGFAHGFLTLSKRAEVLYKATNFWNKDLERTINWNDKELAIEWPIKSINFNYPFLSGKDNNGISFEEAIKNSELL